MQYKYVYKSVYKDHYMLAEFPQALPCTDMIYSLCVLEHRLMPACAMGTRKTTFVLTFTAPLVSRIKRKQVGCNTFPRSDASGHLCPIHKYDLLYY